MEQMGCRFLLAAALTLAGAQNALAQTGKNYDVKTMNFDLWCQEEAQLPADRCDKRLPADEQTFEAYRDKIERYEIPYLQQKSNDADIDRNILHNDPVDNPLQNDNLAAAQRQDPQPAADQTAALENSRRLPAISSLLRRIEAVPIISRMFSEQLAAGLPGN